MVGGDRQRASDLHPRGWVGGCLAETIAKGVEDTYDTFAKVGIEWVASSDGSLNTNSAGHYESLSLQYHSNTVQGPERTIRTICTTNFNHRHNCVSTVCISRAILVHACCRCFILMLFRQVGRKFVHVMNTRTVHVGTVSVELYYEYERYESSYSTSRIRRS